MKRLRIAMAAGGIIAAVAAAWMWAAQQGAAPHTSLAADLPSGALMTIESPDFGHLLHAWDGSPEQAAWMRSASFSAFGNSRLWGRLTDAEQEFAGTADADFDAKFLRSVAGTETIFAWYDIGSLEFLYITRLPPGQAQQVQLLAQRGKFSERKAGDATYYVRTGSKADQSDGTGQQRTVAFAQSGGFLLLATREDLIANALLRMQGHKDAQGIAEEGWFQAATKATTEAPGDLHMMLDLQRLARTPQFETYWVQRNVTATRRYRAAVVDLYCESGHFREERTLLPMDASTLPAGSEDAAALEQLVPDRAGVYRIAATPAVADALAELRDKVLERSAASASSSTTAPVADLSVPEAGDAQDLETRIDAPQPVAEPPDAWLAPLRQALGTESLTAMMSVSRSDASSASMFIPIHSAVVLRRSTAWDEAQLSAAILTALQRRLTVGAVGLAWKREQAGPTSYLLATGAQPIALAIHGNTAILSSDPALLRDMLARSPQSNSSSNGITAIAGFRQVQEQPAFLRLTTVLDGASPETRGESSDTGVPGSAPAAAFFRDNIGSLTRNFSALDSEHFTQRTQNGLVRQTVLYTWKSPASPSR
jgi:hypothetical protein